MVRNFLNCERRVCPLVNDLLLFGVLLVAVAAGWYAGRASGRQKHADSARVSGYYQGLNYLLDAEPNGAVDAFIDGLDVNSETVETHLAVGSLLRRRGEADRAVRVHQNLLSRPSLPARLIHRAHLELAKDYISAGLLDRAERLLQDLASESAEQRKASLTYLVSIYERQKDWSQAVASAEAILPRRSLLSSSPDADEARAQRKLRTAIAHYHCEIASEAMAKSQWGAARVELRKALERDRRCVRASLLLGELEYRCGDYRAGIRALQSVRQQDPEAVPETLALLKQGYEAIDDLEGLSRYLQRCLDKAPSATLVLEVARYISQTQDKRAASAFLAAQLRQRPSLRSVSQWLQWLIDEAGDESQKDDLSLLQSLLQALIDESPVYRCRQCGFSGRQLHWQCPGCQQWGTTTGIRGLDGE
ncbi:MAG: lipopolysaccharide assembly protein LapB [Gammaproteobacteria bacterium]|nr:MAG: lipopolysaccharide assembly protein LapB [Gammaproteobacteria bacterium]